ncbi:acetate/propionate family kinase [Rhodobacter sp. CZR27]|uniref:acetate/propionate family kinase n=1 Tax=Rhodobacter sp. CZR27 TaxID=2033869 RepID=UPI000BBEF069|nr:acetate/propionate family kinase [Rhodobacter sp. CZR27]
MSLQDILLVVNAGSSSLKFQLFDIEAKGLSRRFKGQVDGIGTHPRLVATDGSGAVLVDESHPAEAVPDVPAGIAIARDWLRQLPGLALKAVGHRVVHGGPAHDGPVRVTPEVLDRLSALQHLAPLHQPHNLAPIRLLLQAEPDLPQVACFDTAFHRNHPEHADWYALPRHLHDEGIRRYGFHGLSYEFIASRLPQVAPDLATGRVIVAHLGSGASMCALRNGRSIESTMGFTALDGLPMGSRPGQLDPGVVLHLIAQKGMSADEVSDMLYRSSGLKGLSGVSNDMRDLLDSPDERAAFAVGHFVYRCALNAGMLAAALGGLDGIVFTAGVGENAPAIRAAIVDRLGWLGAALDPARNAAGETRISSDESRVGVFVIPTDEGLMIARHTAALLNLSPHPAGDRHDNPDRQSETA